MTLYIPQHFRLEDREEMLRLMRENAFAALVCSGDQGLHVSHIPFVVESEGGEVLETIGTGQSCFACALGGADGRTLFIMVAEWPGPENMDVLFRSHTGQMLTVEAPAPGAGWP